MELFILRIISYDGRSALASDGCWHLQDAGLIRYKRGKITIIDRNGLEETAWSAIASWQKLSSFSPA
jgi:hypothetical protein